MIHTSNLVKVHENGYVTTPALRNVNLDIDEGEFVAVVGASGSGKTSLLNILGLIDSPTSGELIFMKQNVSTASEKQRVRLRRDNIGFVFQHFNLIDELTVFENIELPLIYSPNSHKERKKRIDEILEHFKISHKKRSYPYQLSNLQQQTVAIARAIVFAPKVIFADEPTGNLDSADGSTIMDLLTMVNEMGTGIVLMTHSTREVQRAQRIIGIHDGHIVKEIEN